MTRPTRIAFQGAPGAFGEEAARRWREGADPLPCAGFADVLDAVERDEAAAGVLPIENRIVGPVVAARAALEGRGPTLRAIGEVTVPVALCVLAPPGVALATLRAIRSHPVALAQCGAFLAAHPALAPEPWWDTAGAARDVARDAAAGRPGLGALASRLAARRWGLAVLAADVQDVAGNWTRFVVVERSR